MNDITNSELEITEGSSNPKLSIHIFIFNEYKETRCEKTQNWILQTLINFEPDRYIFVENYLRNSVIKNEQFKPYKDQLLALILKSGSHKLESWVYEMSRKEFSKQLIFEILSELFGFIQFNPKTENNDSYYDLVAHYLNRFTYLDKGVKILPINQFINDKINSY